MQLTRIQTATVTAAVLAVAILVVTALLMMNRGADPAHAHTGGDPPGCSSTSKTFTLLKFRDLAPVDGVGETPFAGAVQQGETIYFQVRLESVPGSCAIEGGTFLIDPPPADGVPFAAGGVDVTPAGGIPCLGGTIAPCVNGVTSVMSDQLSYEVDCSDQATGGAPLTWEGEWTGGFNHTDPHTGTSAWDSQVIPCADARISITPNGTNEVGDTHTLTCSIEIDEGNGFVPAPDGTECEVSITNSGPGTLSAVSCLTSGGTGTCTVDDDSDDAGIDEIQACTDVTVLGLTLSRCTEDISPDPTTDDCEPSPTTTPTGENAVKCWVDARISITPNGTNEVGDTHTFTCTVEIDTGSGFEPAPDGTECDVSITNGGPGTITGSPCLTVGGSCTVDDDSDDAGIDEALACADVTVLGLTLTRCTEDISPDPVAPDDCDPTPTTTTAGENAVKCWVDARISITPNGTNATGDTHTLTCTIEVNDGSGWALAPDGTECDVSITNGGPGTITGSPCLTVGGSCTVDDDSDDAGIDEIQACADVTVLGLTLSRCTEDISPDPTTDDCEETPTTTPAGESAVKCWVDARISITPNGTNEVGDTHTFTCTVEVDTGSGFEPAPDGTECDVSITNGGPGTITGSACITVLGSCTVDDDSDDAGIDEVQACADVTIGGVTFNLCTEDVSPDPTAPDDCDLTPTATTAGENAVKCWVDARISITPNGTNATGDTHTLTCTIEVNDGSGWAPAPDGTECEVSITNGGPGTITGSPCLTVGGSCTVDDDSNDAGIDEIQACAEVTVAGLTLSRCTENISPDPTTSDCEPSPTTTPAGENAVKCWVDARISITPNGTNEVGDTHTFTCTVEIDTGSGFEPVPDGTECDVSITNGGPGTITGSPCLTVGGSCTVDDDSDDAGIDEVQACADVTIGGVTFNLCTEDISPDPTAPDDCDPTPTTTPAGENAVKCWVDARISITPNGTNLVGETHTFTCHIEVNDGSGWADAPDGTQCDVAITNGGPGVLSVAFCLTSGGTGTCTVDDTALSTGIDEVQACTDVTVVGVLLNRCTNDIPNPTSEDCEPTPTPTNPGDNAVKCWIQAPAGGCTPGFWKTHTSTAVWGPTGYSPGQTLESVFDVPDALGMDNDTLLQALNYGGGPGTSGAAKILLRAAVAAILNAGHPDVGSVYGTEAEIIADVNAALASGSRSQMLSLATELDIANNEGCTIDAHGNPE